jgi:hypothetical protein
MQEDRRYTLHPLQRPKEAVMARRTVVRVALATLAFTLVSFSGGADPRQQATEAVEGSSSGNKSFSSRIRRGFEIAPVPLDLRRKNRALVGLGSYIVNAQGGCNDCHTSPPFAPGGNPFLGEPTVVNTEVYLAGGTPFGPDIVSRNLTPDEFGRPAGLTLEEFATAIRTGRDPENPDRILQVMPWPVYSQMTDMDLRAVYEYLRAIPSLPDNQPEPPPAP